MVMKYNIYNVNGIQGTSGEICRYFNLNYNTVYQRAKRKQESFEEAAIYYIENGVKDTKPKFYTVNGFTGNKLDICKHFKITPGAVEGRSRLHPKESFEDIINYYIENGVRDAHRIIHNVRDVKGSKSKICNYYKIKIETVKLRMKKYNETFEEAIEYYIDNGVNNKEIIKTLNGFTGNIKKICNYFDIDYNLIKYRMNKYNESFEDACNYYIFKINRLKGRIFEIYDFKGTMNKICEHFEINIYDIYHKIYNSVDFNKYDAKDINIKVKPLSFQDACILTIKDKRF